VINTRQTHGISVNRRSCIIEVPVLYSTELPWKNCYHGNFTWAKKHTKTAQRPVMFYRNSTEYSTLNFNSWGLHGVFTRMCFCPQDITTETVFVKILWSDYNGMFSTVVQWSIKLGSLKRRIACKNDNVAVTCRGVQVGCLSFVFL